MAVLEGMVDRSFMMDLEDEAATLRFSQKLVACLPEGPMTIHLAGPLGAGKTTLVRGCLRALGHQGSVKSPTFTLVEEYAFSERPVLHFDLYRLGDPEELEWIGIRDYLSAGALTFIEWPEKGSGILPKGDLVVHLMYHDLGRKVGIDAKTPVGQACLEQLERLDPLK
jgi:tRNA threonylcarbamoyladenosine biosynthesis protein TsaE